MASRPNIRRSEPATPPDDLDAFIEEFRGYLVIDISQLDVEIAQHSEAFYQVAERYALAMDEEETAKQTLEETKSSTDISIRLKLEKAEAEGKKQKPTETQIKSMVGTADAVLDAQEAHNNARRRSARLKALDRAYETRSRMLPKLADLYAANWYSDSEGRATKKQLQDAAAKAGRKMLAAARDAQDGYARRK